MIKQHDEWPFIYSLKPSFPDIITWSKCWGEMLRIHLYVYKIRDISPRENDASICMFTKFISLIVIAQTMCPVIVSNVAVGTGMSNR